MQFKQQYQERKLRFIIFFMRGYFSHFTKFTGKVTFSELRDILNRVPDIALVIYGRWVSLYM